MRLFRPASLLKGCLIALGLLAVQSPLRAQLDPRLACSSAAGSPESNDFLDLYQQSTTEKPKPEILTIFDFSGSMRALMYHPLYNNTDVSDKGEEYLLEFYIDSSYVPQARLVYGQAIISTSSLFIKPDGSVLSGTTSDLEGWIRSASHVRFSRRVDRITRTIDIPLAWKVMDRNSKGSPLSSLRVQDKVTKTAANGVTTTYGSSEWMEYDLTHSLQSILYQAENGTYRLNGVAYKADYVKWLFSGKYTDGRYSGKYIIYDAANQNLAGGQSRLEWGQGFGTFGSSDIIDLPEYRLDGTYVRDVQVPASSHVIPALTRVQATKKAAIDTWIKYQADVYWAFRFLDPLSEASSSKNAYFNNSDESNTWSSDPTTEGIDGNYSAWVLLNNTSGQSKTSGNSVKGMKIIASLFANNGTPLTYAMARGLAQFCKTDNVFSKINTTPSQCGKHFLLLFTDGVDNNNSGDNNANTTTPYIQTQNDKQALNASAGNAAIKKTPSLINRTGTHWNAFTFAGVAAHMANSALADYMSVPRDSSNLSAYTTGTTSPSSFLPFALGSRGSTSFTTDHRITTMTVGVSLGGSYKAAGSPKRTLFLAAAVGDPSRTAHPDVESLVPFEWDPSARSGEGDRTPNSIYFFDATNPTLLSDYLDKAFFTATSQSANSATANPNLPFIGSTLGHQIYLAAFKPPKNGGVMWGGDLMMFATRETQGRTQILDKQGNVLVSPISEQAQWSAMASFSDSGSGTSWKNRILYTRIPGGTTLTRFTDTGEAYTQANTGLQKYVGSASPASYPAGSDAQKRLIQHVSGGDTKGTLDINKRPVNNRRDILGDIINSSPAVLEYNIKDTTITQGIASMPRLTGQQGDRFRLILVGTNQGWLHAFGEVTKTVSQTDAKGTAQQVVQGTVQELWAFMPTDFLPFLGHLEQPSNPHRFMVDGAPTIYHLDLPPVAGGHGNSVFDFNTDASKPSEQAVVVFGLGKGGRSYYALDIRNPFKPELKWTLIPDEADSLPSSRILPVAGPDLTKVKSIVSRMGYSTCTPALGRVKYSTGSAVTLRDAVFLGGGLSNPCIDDQFKGSAATAPKLGRSVLALDVNTGQFLSAADLTTVSATVGPVSKGVIPFEFFLGSGLAQRAYFMDAYGGLWAWGSREVMTDSASPFEGFRVDTSDLAKWTQDGRMGTAPGIRKVSQDSNARRGAYYSTLPAPFRVGAFPGKPYSATSGDITVVRPTPATVGIAMVSGNRNNPLDYSFTEATRPLNHRLTMVFDRQDSRLWGMDSATGPDRGITDDDLNNFTSQNNPASDLITPGKDLFYLNPTSGNPSFGYYINFPGPTSRKFIPKGINDPAVVMGSAFYSIFTPDQADPCTGGSGTTESWLLNDVLRPIVNDSRTNQFSASGKKAVWIGIASNYTLKGTTGVQQAGTTSAGAAGGAGGNGSQETKLDTMTTMGKGSQRFPKVRVWRTVR